MTKTRRSSRVSATSKRRSSVRTPKRSAINKAVNPGESDNDAGGDDVWDFDAPTYYDFMNAKTPGATADRWFGKRQFWGVKGAFLRPPASKQQEKKAAACGIVRSVSPCLPFLFFVDYSHPTPAPRASRASRKSTDSFISTSSVESLVPNRPSLSPSRVVVENGRLTFEGVSDTDDCGSAADMVVENVEFSDTDEEIEFNNWKRAHSLPHDSHEEGASDGTASISSSSNSQDTADGADAGVSGEESGGNESHGSSGDHSKIPATRSEQRSAEPPSRRTDGVLNGKIKKRTKPAQTAAPKLLTIPEERGFMRPTKVVSRRLSMKKRDKVSQQMIAEAIAKSINRGLSKDGASKLTVPKPFQFHETKNHHQPSAQPEKREQSLNDQVRSYLVAAMSAKRKAMDKEGSEDTSTTQGSPRRKPAKMAKPTVPKTPQFATDRRTRREKKLGAKAKAADTQRRVLSKAQEKGTAHTAMRLSPLKPTVPQPFMFRSDAVAERHLTKLREEIAKLRAEEEALQQFRANPLPEFPTPKKAKRDPTVSHASPFSLQTETRGEAYQRQLGERLEELERRRRERAQFRARPIPASIDMPFVPQPSSMPLTEIEEILLSTELRSEERRAYDEDRHERERIREEVLARKRLEDEHREEEEIKQLRKILVHKAQPIRHFKPVTVKPSERLPTVPKTPQWHVRTRRASAPSTPTQP
ncbi:hypothetical protein GQ54DRAFT_297446 [Martensiomyces pterosporus]|nr:hypothetical protein GQ54DRAFT_297446 [Martensiomyces pterosporus]